MRPISPILTAMHPAVAISIVRLRRARRRRSADARRRHVTRRLLTSETLSPDIQFNWSLGYGYNALGHRTAETYPAGLTVTHTTNALGQTTQVVASTTTPSTVTLASNARYYPNGALKQFTYGNGIVHTMNRPG